MRRNEIGSKEENIFLDTSIKISEIFDITWHVPPPPPTSLAWDRAGHKIFKKVFTGVEGVS